MSLILSLALRNALRNRVLSALTAGAVLAGTALLTIALSWINGVYADFVTAGSRALGHVRVVNAEFPKRESLAPLYLNIPDTGPMTERLAALPGVEGVYPRIQVGVTASSEGDVIGETFGMVVGAPVPYFAEVLGLDQRVSEGAFFSSDPEKAAAEALIGRTLAGQMKARVGAEAIFVGQTQDGSISPIKVKVVGIVDSGNGLFDRQVFVPLEKVRWLADIPQGATEVLVYGASPDEAVALAATVRAALSGLEAQSGLQGGALVTQAWNEREPWSTMTLLIEAMLGFISAIFVFIAGLVVLNLMLMSVLRRTGEIGVLRALGLRAPGVVALFVIEALAIAAVGGALGVALGALPSMYMETHGLDIGSAVSKMPDTMPVNRMIRADWSLDVGLRAFGLGLLMALVGAATPSIRAARIQPVEAMRARR